MLYPWKLSFSQRELFYGWSAGWFKNRNKYKDLEELLSEAFEISKDAIDQMKGYLTEGKYVLANSFPEVLLWIKGGLLFSFSRNEDENENVVLPKEFGYFFASQAILSKGIISDNLKKSFYENKRNIDKNIYYDIANIKIEKNMNKSLIKTIKERMDYCNKVAAFFMENNIQKGLLKYGWFLDPKTYEQRFLQ